MKKCSLFVRTLISSILVFLCAGNLSAVYAARANSNSLVLNGWEAVAKGNYEEGRRLIHRAIQRDPSPDNILTLAKSYWVEGSSLLTKGDAVKANQAYVKAESHARVALQRSQEQSYDAGIYEASGLLAMVLLQRGNRHDEACRVLEPVVTLEGSTLHQYLYGLCSRFQYYDKPSEVALLERSALYLSKSIDGVDPLQRPLAYFYLGVDALNAGDDDLALHYLSVWMDAALRPERSVILYQAHASLLRESHYLITAKLVNGSQLASAARR